MKTIKQTQDNFLFSRTKKNEINRNKHLKNRNLFLPFFILTVSVFNILSVFNDQCVWASLADRTSAKETDEMISPELGTADAGTTLPQDAAVSDTMTQLSLISKSFRETSKKVLPSVVKIIVRGESGKKSRELESIPLKDLFPGMPDAEQITGVGSGVLVDSKGIILTNCHVVAGTKNITVELYDGREFSASSVKKDAQSDLAVVTLDLKEETLPTLHLADSDSLEIGDWVLAVGNPFMLDSSVSAGIVSAKGRHLGNKDRGEFIQTDAAINPGNSGGPLVNLKGDIVGINTSIASLNGGYQGVGFAIPSNTVRWIMEQLLANGKVERAFIGAPLENLKPSVAKDRNISPKQGVLLGTPFKDSPAVKAGLRRDDIILTFDGQTASSPESLQILIERADVKTEHQITLLRRQEKMTLSIKLELLPENYVGVPVVEKVLDEGKHFNDKKLGIMLIPMTDDAAKRLGFEGKSGILILNVMPGGQGYRAGFRDGMLIEKINGQNISAIAEYTEIRDKISEALSKKNSGESSEDATSETDSNPAPETSVEKDSVLSELKFNVLTSQGAKEIIVQF